VMWSSQAVYEPAIIQPKIVLRAMDSPYQNIFFLRYIETIVDQIQR